MNTTSVKAFGTEAKDKDLQLMQIERREVTPTDIEIDILYCGVCHSDLHTAKTTGVELNILLFRDTRSLAELQK